MVFKDELFNKLGSQNEIKQDVFQLIRNGDQKLAQRNEQEAREFYNSAVTVGASTAQSYEEKKQFRFAASQYYGISIGYLRLGEAGKAQKGYENVSSLLRKAANIYIKTYQEYEDGVICVIFASLIEILQGKYKEVEAAYQEYLKIFQDIANEGRTTSNIEEKLQSLSILRLILQGITETEHAKLQQAQHLFATNINPKLLKTKLTDLKPLIEQTINYAHEELRKGSKFPEVTVSANVPSDAILDKPFGVILTLKNTGAGTASDCKLVLGFSKELTLTKGGAEMNLSEIATGESKSFEFEFNLSKITQEFTNVDFHGRITFSDMLKNEHVVNFGPYIIKVQAESIKEKYKKTLSEKIEGMSDSFLGKSESEIIQIMQDGISAVVGANIEYLREQFQNKNYTIVENALTIFEEVQKMYKKHFGKEGKSSKKLQLFFTNLESKKTKDLEAQREELTKRFKAEAQKELEKSEEEFNQLKMTFNHYKEETEKFIEMEKETSENKLKSKMEEATKKYLTKIEELERIIETKKEESIKDAVTEIANKYVQKSMQLQSSEKSESKKELIDKLNQNHTKQLRKMLDEYEAKLAKQKAEFMNEKSEIRENVKAEIVTSYKQILENYTEKLEQGEREVDEKIHREKDELTKAHNAQIKKMTKDFEKRLAQQ